MTCVRKLLERLEMHRALKDASPGFHLSDDDIDILIEALRKLENDHGA